MSAARGGGSTGGGAALLCLLMAGLFLAAAPAVEARDLMQSATCLQTVPKCTPGQCSSLQGSASGRLVCNRCLNNYAPVTRVINGAKYIVQCVCPKGQYSQGNRCYPCPTGTFCPGGDFIDSPSAELGRMYNCSVDGLITTRGPGAQSASACVAPAGYVISSFRQLGNGATARLCTAGTYATAYNRLQACIKCQAGLAENPADGLGTAAKPRSDVNTVCKVPPGKWYSQNVVKTCAAGLYRSGFVAFKNQTAATCTACPTGVSTLSAGATNASACTRVLPGYGLTVVTTPYIPGVPGTLPLAASALDYPDGAAPCAYGNYSLANQCVWCPYNTTTRQEGSASISDCMIPPGYYQPGPGMDIVTCNLYGPNLDWRSGYYRAGWVSWNSTAGKSCSYCGDNIWTYPLDQEEDPRNPSDSRLAASPQSCYVDRGYGVTYDRSRQVFVANECPADTYGVSNWYFGTAAGMVAAPCKACPRGMITSGLTGMYSADMCTNPAGYGYSSEGATPCAPGFWAASNSKLPCAQCAAGRWTVDNSAQQTSVLACKVLAGYGLAAADAAAAGSNTTAQALANAAPCDTGFYQPSNATLNATCLACPAGTTTSNVGAAICDVCVAGYGRPGGNGACTLCGYNTYARTGDTGACTTCPTTDFSNVAGDKVYTSQGVTMVTGATGSELCVPAASHLAQDAGQLIAMPAALVASSNQTNLTACIGSCGATKCCIAAWTASTGSCALTTLNPVALNATVAASRPQILYKLPLSDRVGASSVDADADVGAKVLPSNVYAQCEVPVNTTAFADGSIGTNLDAAARAAVATGPVFVAGTVQACRGICDISPTCWGFVFNSTHCSFRGGEDALGVDTFFVLPTNATAVNLRSLNW